MKKVFSKKQTVLIIILIVIAVILGFAAYCNLKAINLAKNHLLQKYDKEMDFQAIDFSFTDPSRYVVYFEDPDYEDELVVAVIVQNNLTITESIEEFGQDVGSADNYYLRIFENKMEKVLPDIILPVFKDSDNFAVRNSSDGLYSFYVSSELTESMDAFEMEKHIGSYIIFFDIPNYSNETAFAEKVFELMNAIEENGLTPESIHIYSKETKETFVFYPDEIVSIDEVLEQIELFSC